MSNALIEEALFNSHVKTLYSLTESDLKTLDKDLTSEELNALMESFQEDPELMLEFLGTIAGLGGKAAKFMSSKFSGAAKGLGKLGKKATDFSNQRALKGEQHKARKAHTNAVKAYGKSLKGSDPKARKAALAAMVTARNNSRMTRGKSSNLGATSKGNPKKAKGKYASDPRTRNNMYKRLGECMIDLLAESLDGGFTTFSNPDNEDNDVSYRKFSKKRQAQLKKAGHSKKKVTEGSLGLKKSLRASKSKKGDSGAKIANRRTKLAVSDKMTPERDPIAAGLYKHFVNTDKYRKRILPVKIPNKPILS